jgi:hypothetical protein
MSEPPTTDWRRFSRDKYEVENEAGEKTSGPVSYGERNERLPKKAISFNKKRPGRFPDMAASCFPPVGSVKRSY